MSKRQSRIPYITREEWTDGSMQVFTTMARSEEEREIARKEGHKMNMINVFAHFPKLAVPYLELGKDLFQISVPMRLREIAVLRLSHLSNSGYEWFQHEAIGRFVGLVDEDFEAIKQGTQREEWSEIDGLVMEAAEELHKTDTISDALWGKLGSHFNREQMFEFVIMISYYKMTAWLLNALDIPPDETPQGRPPV